MIEIPLTPVAFAAKAQRLSEEQGIALTGNEGQVSKMGVKVGYHYDGSVLKLEVLDKPMFVTLAMCEQQLRAWLGA